MSSTPPLQKLLFALAVARDLHFTKAAARLNVSQPYLSRVIREFERELGFLLFRRNRRVVEITPTGRNFLEYARDMLADLNSSYGRAVDSGRIMARQDASSFAIGYSAFVASRLRCQIRAIQRVRFPALRLEMREASSAETFDSIAGSVFQAGLAYAPLDRKDVAQIPVSKEQLHVVFRRDHFSKDQREIGLADLRSQALIAPCSERAHPALRRWFLEQCGKAGFTPNIAEEVSSPASVFDLVEDGVGLAILPGSTCEGLPPELESAPIANLERLTLVFAFRRNASAAIQKIVSEIAKSLQNFERRRKIFFEPKSSPKRPVVPIDSKRSRTNNWKASSNA